MTDNDVRCPHCGSPNTIGPDPYMDCIDCGTWFDPDDPSVQGLGIAGHRARLTSSDDTEQDDGEAGDDSP